MISKHLCILLFCFKQIVLSQALQKINLQLETALFLNESDLPQVRSLGNYLTNLERILTAGRDSKYGNMDLDNGVDRGMVKLKEQYCSVAKNRNSAFCRYGESDIAQGDSLGEFIEKLKSKVKTAFVNKLRTKVNYLLSPRKKNANFLTEKKRKKYGKYSQRKMGVDVFNGNQSLTIEDDGSENKTYITDATTQNYTKPVNFNETSFEKTTAIIKSFSETEIETV